MVLVTEPLHRDALLMLEKRIEVLYAPELQNHFEELDQSQRHRIEALIVRTRTEMRSAERVCEQFKNLRAVVRAGSGLDHLDKKGFEENEVKVQSTPGANARSAAELTLFHILNMIRSSSALERDLFAGQWNRKKGHELGSFRYGILGLGRVGRESARLLQSLGQSVFAYDPLFPSQKELNEVSTDLTSVRLCGNWDEVADLSDILLLHVPLTPETKKKIDGTFLTRHPGLRMINLSRGEVVCEDAADQALRAGTLKAFATDVFLDEPVAENHPLFKSPNFFATPHIGGATEEAFYRTSLQAVKLILEQDFASKERT